MRKNGTRGSRAKRRQSSRPRTGHAETPENWPSSDTLVEALPVNELARKLLDEMKPEVMRTILQRMDTPARKAVLEPHNIPVTKVSLRAASQVLALLRAEESPAESTLLGTLLMPAAELFHEAVISSGEITGMRLKLVDLALPLVVHNDSVVRGLRTWHRWAHESFEDLTLAAVVGLRCSHAALAAAYLAANHSDIAEGYDRLREEYPSLPPPSDARLTATNPLTRYLAARPDRKLPANGAELRMMLSEDTRVRNTEMEQAQLERDRAQARRREAYLRQRQQVIADEGTAQEEPTATPEPEAVVDAASSDPALPSVTEWAAAVAASRRMTEQLIAGSPAPERDLAMIGTIGAQLNSMSELLTRVLSEPVAADRTAIDKALTLILSDQDLSEKLGPMPGTRGQVTARLAQLPRTPAQTPESAPGAPVDRASATEAPPAGQPDLSDLDAILRGETGNQLAALAGAASPDEPDGTPPATIPRQPPAPSAEVVAAKSRPDVPAPAPTEHVPSQAEVDFEQSVYRLVAIALTIRIPQGPLAGHFTEVLSRLDGKAMEADRAGRTLALCAAMPVALIDPNCGAAALLAPEIPELSGYPRLLAFRESLAELSRQGIELRDPALRRLGDLTTKMFHNSKQAREFLATAETKTFKFDKATKVYRAWLAPGGRLRGLLDALAESASIEEVGKHAEECRRVGASRAVDDTISEIIDANKTRIVAGARKTLTEKYNEVLELADIRSSISREIQEEKRTNRASVWKFDTLNRFREQAHKTMADVEAELADIQGPFRYVAAMAYRAMSVAISPDPLYGPELSIEQAQARLLGQPCEPARS